MTKVKEIEIAIHSLTPKERWDLLHRFDDELWQDWDLQIETDLKEGNLADLLNEARADIAAGRTRPLDEVLDNP